MLGIHHAPGLDKSASVETPSGIAHITNAQLADARANHDRGVGAPCTFQENEHDAGTQE